MTNEGCAMNKAETEHELLDLGIIGDAYFMHNVGNQAGCRQHLIALVNAHQKLGRSDIALDRTELYALDLPRNRS